MKKLYSTLYAALAMTFAAQFASAEKLPDGTYSLPGTYKISLYDYKTDGNKNAEITATISYNAASNEYVIKEQDTKLLPYNVLFTYDEEAKELSFPQSVSDEVAMTSFSAFTYDMGTTLVKEYKVKFNNETGIIEFPDSKATVTAGFCWLPSEQIDNIYYETMYQFEINSFVQVEEEGNDNSDSGDVETPGESEWKDVGEATFVDGWILPMLEIDQNKEENQYKVMLQQNNENPCLYRLVNPYMTGPAAPYNEHSSRQGYIEFDVTNPDWVLFNKVGAGFAYNHPTEGLKKFKDIYCVNHLRESMDKYGYVDPAQVTGTSASRFTLASTFVDGVVTLSMDTADKLGYGSGFVNPDARYATPEDGDKIYHMWYNSMDRPLDMTAKIIFPKVETEFVFGTFESYGSNSTEYEDASIVTCMVSVTVSNLPEETEVEVYYSLSNDEVTFEKADRVIEDIDTLDMATSTTKHSFSIDGLTKGQAYKVYVYAKAGNAKSDIQEFNIDENTTGVNGIYADNDITIRYFNLQGAEINHPTPGTMIIRMEGGKATKEIAK